MIRRQIRDGLGLSVRPSNREAYGRAALPEPEDQLAGPLGQKPRSGEYHLGPARAARFDRDRGADGVPVAARASETHGERRIAAVELVVKEAELW